jgi:hypothetical protein
MLLLNHAWFEAPAHECLLLPDHLQGYIISQEAGCRLCAHNVPAGFHGLSLILDYRRY